MAKHSSSPGYTTNNDVRLVTGGAPFFALLEEMIDNASESLHLQIYIFEGDETGLRVADALQRAAQRGVQVYMLLDGYASRPLLPGLVSELKQAGIHFRWFQPLFTGDSFFVGRRMHHKIVVADARHSLVGGMNITNRYNDLPDQPAWLDWAVYATGSVAAELHNRCVQMWFRRQSARHAQPVPEAVVGECLVRMRVNDWVQNKNQISRSYLEMLKGARQSITIMSSYFMPGRVFRKNLRLAASRGLHIRIILTKVSDIPIAKQAERFFYPWLLRRNIEVYEYREKVLHGKIACSDGAFVTVGSYNFNDLSAYASIELNLDIHNAAFGSEVTRALDEIIARDCDRVTEESLNRSTHWWNRVVYRLAYAIGRTFLFVFTIRFDRERRSSRHL